MTGTASGSPCSTATGASAVTLRNQASDLVGCQMLPGPLMNVWSSSKAHSGFLSLRPAQQPPGETR